MYRYSFSIFKKEQLKWKQTKIVYPLTILSKFSTWTDIQLTPNQQSSLMELANKTPKEKCDNNKIALKVTKIQNMSKQLKTAWEELDIYKQLLTENMELTLKKNEEPKQINTINFNEYSEVKEINYNLENISDSIVKEILDIYTNFVNLDHHLDSNEVRLEVGLPFRHYTCICSYMNMSISTYVTYLWIYHFDRFLFADCSRSGGARSQDVQ